mmetsp:Transcript_23018/g.54575  ORF Transcript_23018/g.54575 Transcript_23018/m.54575 type:complete len:501 (+) Transcript_23018:46-1548(+)
MKPNALNVAVLAACGLTSDQTDAYIPSLTAAFQRSATFRTATALHSTSTVNGETASSSAEDAFSAFADSLDEDTLFDDEDGDAFGSGDAANLPTWQESLDSLLDPTTPAAKRQILLSDLLNASDDIRESVQDAVANGKIDPILTPTGKRLQDGTRAVARQITTDILPGIAEVVSSGPPTPNNIGKASRVAPDLPTLVPKLGSRIFDAISNQARQNLELLQGDLADPSRIPERLSKQASSVAKEAKNVFLETPEGLEGPAYKVLSKSEGYEIREYEAYTVASTSMAKIGEPYSMDDVASGGAGFNALAAYLFGANGEGKSMEMTTPVATTSLGEMRFYLKPDGTVTTDKPSFPQPLTEKDEGFNEKGKVTITEVPASRLAVRRFTGFVTEGEVARQKDALLSSLAIDGVEVDVPHGRPVPHIVLQYNPPYTVPIVRRNEIAVPVREPGVEVGAADLETEWGGEASSAAAEDSEQDDEPAAKAAGGADIDDIGPSDVEDGSP